MTMPTTGTRYSKPGQRVPAEEGNHPLVTVMCCTSGICIPSRKAAIVVRPNDEKPPMRAAVRAGTTSSTRFDGSTSDWVDATRMPSSAVMAVASTQLAPARTSGE